MSRTEERWRRLTAEALERADHCCEIELPCCSGVAITVVVTLADVDSDDDPAVLSAGAKPLTADRLRAACAACKAMLEPTAEQVAAEQAAAEEAEPEGSYADQVIALRVPAADGVEHVVWMTLEKARAYERRGEGVAYWPGQPLGVSLDDEGGVVEEFVDPSIRPPRDNDGDGVF